MPDEILYWGIELILWLQSLGDWPAGLMNLFTFTGYAEFYLLIMPAVYWCWDSRLGLRLAVVFLLSTALNFYVKLLIHDPRPYWLEPEVRLLSRAEITFGAPSGHAQNAVAVWGTLAAYLKSSWAWVIAGLLMFFVGLSRIYLGVHFPTDVLIGWLMNCVPLPLHLTASSKRQNCRMRTFTIPYSGIPKTSLIHPSCNHCLTHL